MQCGNLLGSTSNSNQGHLRKYCNKNKEVGAGVHKIIWFQTLMTTKIHAYSTNTRLLNANFACRHDDR